MRMGQERGAAMDRTGPLPGLAVACWHALWARRPTPLSLPCPASDAHVGRRARRGRAPRAGRLSSRTRRGHRSRRTSRHSPRATRRSGPRGPCALSCGRSRHGRTRRPCGHSRRGRRSRSSRHHSRRHSSRRRILRTSRRSGSPFRSPRPFPGCSCRTHRRSGPSRIRRHSRRIRHTHCTVPGQGPPRGQCEASSGPGSRSRTRRGRTRPTSGRTRRRACPCRLATSSCCRRTPSRRRPGRIAFRCSLSTEPGFSKVGERA
mmetsp:Transcript_16025/g.51399  ORF Transcript_16025/g.51399 Transcript_16025/m.51399 type:complete len:261 (-) Transcript_16025:8-790(-)